MVILLNKMKDCFHQQPYVKKYVWVKSQHLHMALNRGIAMSIDSILNYCLEFL